MKVSEIIGKRILSTGGRDGYVISVNAANGKITGLHCADGDEREFCVDFANIIKLGEKIIYRESENACRGCAPLRLGRACFNESGAYLGKLEDFSFFGDRIKNARIGKKNYPAEGLVFGDIIIVKNFRRLTSDVKKDGKTLYKKGSPVTDGMLAEAAAAGEYVQTTLKSL